jgi:hypothetical protein
MLMMPYPIYSAAFGHYLYESEFPKNNALSTAEYTGQGVFALLLELSLHKNECYSLIGLQMTRRC